MKGFKYLFLLILFSNSIIANDNEIAQNKVKLVIDEDLISFIENFTTRSAPFELDKGDHELRKFKKKKRKKTAAVLGGLANLFYSAGKIANSETSQEKAQEVCNFAGGTLGIFAQLSAIDAAYCMDMDNVNEETKNLYQEALLYQVVPLINYFYEVISQGGILLDAIQFPLLSQLLSFENLQERLEWIVKTLLSNELVQKFLEEIINCIQTYLHDKFPIIIDVFANYLKDSLKDIFDKIREEQKIEQKNKEEENKEKEVKTEIVKGIE